MKIIKLLVIIFLTLAICLIPFTFFEIKYQKIFIVIGYTALVVGQILNIIYLIRLSKRNKK